MNIHNKIRLRTIVVEDERLPRLSLLQKLEEFSNEIEVVGCCDNYNSALQTIVKERPDLLFLDIQLQGRDAIQLLEELQKIQTLPYVIFTTAYNDRHYLMSAIKISAVDYLIKPIDQNELTLAIAKAVQRKRNEKKDAPNRQGLPEDKISLKTVSGKVLIKDSDIVFIYAYGNYSKLTTFSDCETIMESLGTMENKLPSDKFVRCDRSTIVNMRYIYKIDTKRNVCVFRSDDGVTIQTELSKSAMDNLKRLL